MIFAALKALSDLLSPEMRGVLWKSIGLSIALFAALWFGIEFLVSKVTIYNWAWLTSGLQVLTALGLFAAFFFLMAPVTALFAGLFTDGIASKLEARHYANQPAGRALSYATGLITALKFAGLTLGIEIVLLPTIFFLGFGAILILCANAYLIGREYFEMTAARYMPVKEAAALRRAHALRIFLAGLIPGALAMVPFVNFTTPVFATSYFLHYFKQGR